MFLMAIETTFYKYFEVSSENGEILVTLRFGPNMVGSCCAYIADSQSL
jgi:hypothetical protein